MAYWISAPYRPGRGPRRALRRPAAGDRVAAAADRHLRPRPRPAGAGGMTRVLVTGGGGFVGRQVVPHLRDAGFDVVAPSSAEADLLAPGVPARLAQTTAADVLVHLAWEAAPGYATSPANPAWLRASLELATAFVAAGGRRIVAAGSCAEIDLERPTPVRRLQARAAPRPARPDDHATGASWPGRACSSSTAPASTRSGWSPRWPRASRPAERRSRPPAGSAATTSTCATPVRRSPPWPTSNATGLFDVATRRRAGGGRHRAGDRDRGRPPRTAAPRRAAVRPTRPPLIVGDPGALRAATGWCPQIALADGLRDAVATASRNQTACR